jgi:hypothetical protein
MSRWMATRANSRLATTSKRIDHRARLNGHSFSSQKVGNRNRLATTIAHRFTSPSICPCR